MSEIRLKIGWKRVEAPTASGGRLIFDYPIGWPLDAVWAVLEQAERAVREEYLRTRKRPNMAAFAYKVQARIDMLAGGFDANN